MNAQPPESGSISPPQCIRLQVVRFLNRLQSSSLHMCVCGHVSFSQARRAAAGSKERPYVNPALERRRLSLPDACASVWTVFWERLQCTPANKSSTDGCGKQCLLSTTGQLQCGEGVRREWDLFPWAADSQADSWFEELVSPPGTFCFHPRYDRLIFQQDNTNTTEQISTELGWEDGTQKKK